MSKTYVFDIETYKDGKPILDTNEFVLGVILNDKGKEKIFYEAKEMYNYIIKECEKNLEKGELSFFYAHNAKYDFYGIFKKHLKELMTKEELIIVNPNQLLAIYKKKCYFLDTYSFFPMALEILGEQLGYKKTTMPPTIRHPMELIAYCVNDCKVLKHALITLKEIINDIGFKPKKYLTASQVSMNCFIAYLSRSKTGGYIMQGKGRIHKNEQNYKLILQANRGGRAENFFLGEVENATMIDINSFYWKSMKEITFPDLLKERYIPKGEIQLFNKKDILSRVGVVNATIKTKEKDLGVLGVRIGSGYNYKQYFPHKEHIITGTWTTEEINKAISEGDTIISLNEAVIWDKNLKFNPLSEHVDKLWKERKKYKDNKLWNHTIKLLGNGLYGKLLQTKFNKQYKWIKRHEITEYIEKGWKLESVTDDYCISYSKGMYVPNYSSAILGVLITAKARLLLYDEMKKIPVTDLLYTDTDSIAFKGDHITKYKIGEELGEYKIVDQGASYFSGEKKYKVNETIRIAGVSRHDQTEEILKGEKVAELQNMVNLNTAIKQNNFDNLGRFYKIIKQISIENKRSNTLPLNITEVEK